jgi:tetratricopeptide (TPR) repeat protein/glycosyltransferase involved in cell wall biosynthesis
MSDVVLLTNAWGPKHGGINSFNMDFAKALGVLAAPLTGVFCVVLEATTAEVDDARSCNVRLVPIGGDELSAARASDIVREVRKANAGAPVLGWVGHDVVSGEAAVALPAAAGEGWSAVLHHMSYIDYQAYKHSVGLEAKTKYDRQKKIFSAANKVFGVGPLLRGRLADMLSRDLDQVPMLIPGLAEIEPAALPRTFTAITFGRLDPTNDRIKQGRLAVAAFASACRRAHENEAFPKALRNSPGIKAVGIAEPGGEEEAGLRKLADERAGRVIQLLPLPYDNDRQSVFEQMRRASVALMLSWHEGFGLTGWEAVAAEVPLIVGRGSGLYQLVDELLGGAGLGCLHVIDVRGREGRDGESTGLDDGENFREEDEDDTVKAILKIAADPDRAKRDAKKLRAMLKAEPAGCTWADTARTFANAVGIPLPSERVAPWLPIAQVPSSRRASRAPPPSEPTKARGAALLELPKVSWQPGREWAESQLLRAEEACVPFHRSRRPLLDEVLDWAREKNGAPVALQIRIGVGGAGKTRLMLEACGKLAADAWTAGFLSSRFDGDIGRAALKLFKANARTFVVVDYAEARMHEVAALIDAALRTPATHRVRIMLVAREAGGWGERLAEKYPGIEGFLTGRAVSGPYRLPPIPAEQHDRETIFREALGAFADKLGIEASGIFCPELSAPHFGEVLFIHMSALSALAGTRPETATSLLEAVVRRERRYWRTATPAMDAKHALDGGLQQAVALITLAGGVTTAARARHWIQAAPRLRGAPPADLEAAFQLLRGFYPLAGGIDALRPDVLGERLVAQELANDDELLDLVVTQGLDDEIKSALTMLDRLAHRSPTDSTWLKRGLNRHLARLARVAMDVAVETGDPIGPILAEAIEAAPEELSTRLLHMLKSALPHKTIALREVGLVLAQRHLAELQARRKPPGFKDKQHLALAQLELEQRLDELGKFEEASEVSASLQTRLKSLSVEARTPHELVPFLTASARSAALNLRKLGKYEAALGRANEALSLCTEAVTSQRPMHAEIAAAHEDVAVTLHTLGRYEEALPHAESALAIWRRLAQAQPDAHRPTLSGALRTLAGVLGCIGEYDRAVDLAKESLGLLRELAQARPDAFRARLATTLGHMAAHLSDVGRYEEALQTEREALQISHNLAEARPQVFRGELAMSLANLASHLSALGQADEALQHATAAVDVCRVLASERPEAHKASLANALHNAAGIYSEVESHVEGLRYAEEAVAAHRELADLYPEAYRLRVVQSLANLAVVTHRLGRFDDAECHSKEALDICRVLVVARPEAVKPHLAAIVTAYAVTLSEVGRHAEGVRTYEEALSIYRDLAVLRPRVESAGLATCLGNAASALRSVGQYEAALAAAEEAVAIHRALAGSRPLAHETDLAVALEHVGTHLCDAARYEDGLSAIEESLRLFDNLALSRPKRFLQERMHTQDTAARLLLRLGRAQDALKMTGSTAQLLAYPSLAGREAVFDPYRLRCAILGAKGHLACKDPDAANAEALLACDFAERLLTTRRAVFLVESAEAHCIAARCAEVSGAPDRARRHAVLGLAYLAEDLALRPRRLTPEMQEAQADLLRLAGQPDSP